MDPLFSASTDHEFALELAVTADVLFSVSRPPDPRPTLAALLDKDDWKGPLSTTCAVTKVFMDQVHPVNPDCPRHEFLTDLVTCGLDDVWTLPYAAVERALRRVIEIDDPFLTPSLDILDLLPLSLFAIGLSALIADVSENPFPGDPIRLATGQNPMF